MIHLLKTFIQKKKPIDFFINTAPLNITVIDIVLNFSAEIQDLFDMNQFSFCLSLRLLHRVLVVHATAHQLR